MSVVNRNAWILSGVLFAAFSAFALAASAQPAQIVRRDIRTIEGSPEALRDFRHAVLMLTKRPPNCDDPAAKSEYDCWAAYHNNFDLYGCRHSIDLFWPWHRFHLAEFEKALRSSDPEHPERVAKRVAPLLELERLALGTELPRERREGVPGSRRVLPRRLPSRTAVSQPALGRRAPCGDELPGSSAWLHPGDAGAEDLERLRGR